MKYIVLTGTSSGIGYQTALDLLAKEYFVFGIDIQESKINNLNYKHIKCDLSKDESRSLIKEEIDKLTKHIDGIFNVAGIFEFQSIVEGSKEDLYKVIEINFFAVYKLNKALFEYLDKTSRVIILTSEVARYSCQPFNGYYTMSKVIVDTYADVFRRECNYLGIKVIKVQSGAIKTNLLLGVNDKYKKLVDSSTHYKSPLTKLRKLMDDEIKKQVPCEKLSKKLVKIYECKNPKICYRFKNSFKLFFLISNLHKYK